METVAQYFVRRDAPMPRSPVGRMMQVIHEIDPALDFDVVRQVARQYPASSCLEDRLPSKAAARKALQSLRAPELKIPDIENEAPQISQPQTEPEEEADDCLTKWRAVAFKAEPEPELSVVGNVLPRKKPSIVSRPFEQKDSRYYDRSKVFKAMSRNNSTTVAEPVRARPKVVAFPGRNPLSALEKEQVVDRQGGKCIYCARPFGSKVFQGDGTVRILEIRFDHFEAYALRQNNDKNNIFASCDVCNDFKSDYLFDSLAEAREFLSSKWESKGMSDRFKGCLVFRADRALADSRLGGSCV
jgi:hypothetical protein